MVLVEVQCELDGALTELSVTVLLFKKFFGHTLLVKDSALSVQGVSSPCLVWDAR